MVKKCAYMDKYCNKTCAAYDTGYKVVGEEGTYSHCSRGDFYIGKEVSDEQRTDT